MKTTIPTPDIDLSTEPADLSGLRIVRRDSLARVALEAGVSFDDVRAYVEGAAPSSRGAQRRALEAELYDALVAPPDVCVGSPVPYENLTDALVDWCERMHTDVVLDAALARSVASREPRRSVPFWSGVLPRASSRLGAV